MADLSAIIPTRDRPDLLRDCLATLAQQRLGDVELEVLVVDDGSQEPLAALVADFDAPGVLFRTLRQPPASAAAARNAGVAAAASDLIAFLDDDTWVHEDWAREVVRAFRETEADGVAGQILLHYEGRRPRWLRLDEHGFLSGFDRGTEQLWLRGGDYPYSANCAITRSAFDDLGGFRIDLDRAGNSLLSGGETELYRRLHNRGGRVIYWPAATVRHRVPPSRLRLNYFIRRGFSQGLTDELVEGPPTNVREGVWRIARMVGSTLRLPLVGLKALATRGGVLNPIAWAAYSGGRFAAIRHWRSRASGRVGRT